MKCRHCSVPLSLAEISRVLKFGQVCTVCARREYGYRKKWWQNLSFRNLFADAHAFDDYVEKQLKARKDAD